MVDHGLIDGLISHIILQDATLHQSVRTVILSTFGDIAIAIGTNFSVYWEPVAPILHQVASIQVDKVDYVAVSCDVL